MTGNAPEASFLGKLIEPEIREWIREKNFKELRESLVELDPFDLAEALQVLTPQECAIVFRILPRRVAAEVFAHLPFNEEEELLHSLGDEHVSGILNEMAPDDRTALLEELPGQITRRLIESLSPQERQIARTLLGYPEYSVGRLMTPEYVSIKQDWTVKDTLNHLRLIGKDKETINYIYVTDDHDRLVAYLPLRSLIVASPERLIRDIMRTTMVTLRAADDQETAADVMARYDTPVLPVLDSDGVLVGIVTSDDVLDVVVEETTEDIHLMGGLEALDVPYTQISFISLFRKRAVALLLLFIGGTLTVTAMDSFGANLEAILLIFIPLIISTGGNSGSQAATLVIRAMAIREIGLRDWLRVLVRESSMGLSLGAALGLTAFTLLLLLSVVFPGAIASLAEAEIGESAAALAQTEALDVSLWSLAALSITVGIAITSVVFYGTMIGAMLPFMLKSVSIDPALSSTPLVATLVDATGIVIYSVVAVGLYRILI